MENSAIKYPDIKLCLHCDKPMESPRAGRKFCSDKCRKDHYNEYTKRAREQYALSQDKRADK